MRGRDDTPGLRMRAPNYPVLALIAALVLEWLVPLELLAEPSLTGWQSWLGAALAAGGFGLEVACVTLFRAAGTEADPYKPSTVIVRDGPYRFSRNPIYVGLLLMQLGIGLAFALEWAIVLLPAVWLAIDRLVVRREEAYLSNKFGEDYAAYRRGTRRWL